MTMMIKVIKVTNMSTYKKKLLKFIIYLFMDKISKKMQIKENRTNKYSSSQVIQLNFKGKK